MQPAPGWDNRPWVDDRVATMRAEPFNSARVVEPGERHNRCRFRGPSQMNKKPIAEAASSVPSAMLVKISRRVARFSRRNQAK